MLPRIFAAFALLLCACPRPGTCPTPAAPAAAAAPPTGLGADLVRLADGGQLQKAELVVSRDGTITKRSAYHDSKTEIPGPVLDLVQKEFPDSLMIRFESEHYADVGEIFEVEVETADRRLCEIAANREGVRRYIECELDLAALPEPIRTALSAKFPWGTKFLEAERKTQVSGEEYEVEIDVDGVEHALRFSPTGELLAHHLSIPASIEIPVAP